MRASSLYFAQHITNKKYQTIFCTSYLNIAEFKSLRPDLNSAKYILYFHENQLNYPTRKKEDKMDFQFGWVQIVSCMVADIILFNSQYNMDSFISKIPSHLNKVPGIKYEVESVLTTIKQKSQVLYFPITLEEKYIQLDRKYIEGTKINILWNHRWEYDKNPDDFFNAILNLSKHTTDFTVSVLGETYEGMPEVFEKVKPELEKKGLIKNWGFVPDKAQYYTILCDSHIVISTAIHEFYGVSVLEAVC